MRTSRNVIVLALLLLPAGVSRVAAQAPAAVRVAGAVAAAPDSMRPGATVVANSVIPNLSSARPARPRR